MSSLAALTGQEIELISRFIALLNEEQDALKRADTSPLAEIASEKIKLIEQLNGLELARGEKLGSSDSASIRAAMTHWLEQHPDEKGLATEWAKLLDLARQAKHLHELNSRLVGMHLRHTSEILAVLTRQGQHNSLYGSNGQAAQATGSRIVDSA